MRPEEKAEELMRKYWSSKMNLPIEIARECALIAVDEIINANPAYPWAKDVGSEAQGLYENVIFPSNYWRDVKFEIVKIESKKL